MDRFTDRLPMPISYFELVLRQFGTTPFLRDAILEGTGVGIDQLSEPGAETTLGQQVQLVRNMNRLRPGGWAMAVGAGLQTSTHGPLGFAIVSAPTLGDALDVLVRFIHVRSPSHRARCEVRDGSYRLELIEQVPAPLEDRIPGVEIFLLSIQAMVESVLARPFSEGRFELGYPEPSWSHLYREQFHSDVRFDAPTSALVLPAVLCALRSPLADPDSYASALVRLETLARRIEGLDITAARVEQLLMQTGDVPPSIDEAARTLGFSRRTLIRRLHDAGTTFRDLADAHRSRRAEELLREGTLSISEVCHRLGYEDPANFGRACRRWFGVTPRALHGRPKPSP